MSVDISAEPASAAAGWGGKTQYIAGGGGSLFSVYHPATASARDLAVLVCPPFGWEEVCSHRILRAWSQRLAEIGIASLRWTLPGFGDSTGEPGDDGLVERWIDATDAATRWLRARSGARSVVALGLGLGGMLAYRAASAGTPIDGFVLWNVPARGRDLVRQLRAFSRLESSEFFNDLPSPEPRTDGALEAGGFLLDRATVDALSEIELGALIPPAAGLGALVLARDGIAPDERLRAALAAADIAAAEAPGDGYAAMTSHPQKSVVPEAVVASVESWLAARAGAAADPAPPHAPSTPEVTFVDDTGAAITETPFELRTDDGALRGVISRGGPGPAPVCAVFLNAGAQRRIGPNRMWVETARRWTTRGVASLRLDMLGIGESDGPTSPYERDMTLYRPEFPPRVTAVLDALQRDGVAERFVLVGLCAGAYWALHAGLDDDRVVGIMMLNPVAIIWDDDTTAARDLRRVFTERSWRLIRKNATPQRLRAVARMLAGAPRRFLSGLHARSGGAPSLEIEIERNLARWRDPATRITAMFASREGLAMDLDRSGRMTTLQELPNVTIRRLAVNDHTLRPVAIQHVVHAELDSELARVLAAVTGARNHAPGPS